MGISTKKILIVVLSLTLSFSVGCGDKPTGSGDVDNQINALFDKFPKPSTATDTAVSSSDGLDGNYKSDGNLAIVPDETYAINYLWTKEDFIKNGAAKAGFLEITGGKATGYFDDKSEQSKRFENAQIYKNSSGKYYAVNEITYEEGGYERNYIEFDKDSSGKLTSFKIMRLVRANRGGHNYAVQQTYTGTLIKDTSSGGSQ